MSHHKKPPTPEQIDDMINSGKLPANTPGADWSLFEALTNSDVSSLTTSQDEIQAITGTTASPATVAVEDFTGVSFTTMLHDFQNASGTLDNGNGNALQQISASIINASDTFQQALMKQEATNQWVGKTHDAAIANINQSLPDVSNIGMGANALGLLIDAFSHTIFQTQWYLLKNADGYNESVTRWPNEIDEINQVYDSFAQNVMNTVYAPNITSIASNNPGFSTPTSSADPSSVPPPPPDPPPPPPDPPPPPPPNNSDAAAAPPDNTPPPPPPNVPPPPDPGGNPPPPVLNTNLGPNGSIPAPGDLLGNPAGADPFGGSNNSASGSGDFPLPSGVPGVGSSDFALPGGVPGAGSGDFPLPSGDPGVGSSDFALPGGVPGAGSGDFPLPSGDPGVGSSDFALPGGVPGVGSSDFALPGGDPGAGSSDFVMPGGVPGVGSGNFPLPNATGLANPFGGSGGSASGSSVPGGVPGGPAVPNGAANTDPFVDASNPAGGAGNFVPPSGVGTNNPLSGLSNPAGASGNPAAGLSGLGQAAQGLGEPLQQALGAAQGHPGGMPESGMPGGLGPKDLDALGKPGGGAGHGPGGGAGIGPQGRDTLAPAGAPVAAASKGIPPLDSALARPGGVPLGAGGSPAGAPPGGGGGGQRGPGGKEHKPNKALRRKKNGELVLGDVDAVVPVIGDDGPEEAEAPQRTPAPPVPQTPRPSTAGTTRRAAFEQRTEVGR
ncbi:hypothetical protein OK015_07835 [Mycobacterium sp. Aquia_216]|uniref:hypothetical protein n=1 Tax=Mycobacterium sp. Aquia_216 TaxID=2991729 RepID=UPI00227BDE12|nr:hypothetical protein [Mycobacterium sp. Aquia_216]WAJ46367.1 hypothetical protein OK015_07835 [Mycobacterium sp. Aquia_216]